MNAVFYSGASQNLPLQWYNLCSRVSPLLPADMLLDRLVSAYSEPTRFYHTAEHIAACLSELEGIRELLQFPDAVEWALWLHDVVYNPQASDNEEQSARVSEQILYAAQAELSFIERTTDLILATRHNGSPPDMDTCYLVDIDLTILGSSPVLFATYEENIRREYAWVPEMLYRTKRKEILASFLHRASIYRTDFFRSRYEQQARENLRWSIEQLPTP